MPSPKHDSTSGGFIVVSRLHLLVSQKEQNESRRITDIEIAKATNLSRATIQTYRTPNQAIERFDARVVTALCHWAKCGVGDLLELAKEVSAS